ncbi:transposase [Croceifilum oryzae]|uniref:Transposase n=1 Tax=Croceifilum oryzae TaxID=1553429 RepID=A0AAJ1WS48_9BACL|nr:hypothetical protein [Croceifilum oryzae]MDQ0416668.1 transposase [Croceifilum oryzae]
MRGIEKIPNLTEEAQIQHKKEQVILGMEPTGHYWLNLAHFLCNQCAWSRDVLGLESETAP